MTRLQPYTVVARRQDAPPQRIGVLAYSQADAIVCARELFPQHLITAAMLNADWEDDPA